MIIHVYDPFPDQVPSSSEEALANQDVADAFKNQDPPVTPKPKVARCQKCQSEIGTPGFVFVGNTVAPCRWCNPIV